MNPKHYKIDKQGSLGLLALGDLGLKAWRKVRGKLDVVETKREKAEEVEKKNKRSQP